MDDLSGSQSLDGVKNWDVNQDIFQNATEYVKTIIGRLTAEDLLFFYGRYKQATIGPCNVDKPSFFDFQGKPKWNAWKNLGDMSMVCAKNDYVEKLSSIDPLWTEKLNCCSPAKNQSWACAVSSMVNVEKDLSEDEKTLVDWIKEENVEKVKRLILNARDNDSVIKYRDKDGMGLIHWAADRGNKDIVNILLSVNDLDVNLQDNEGQTALHYASSCGHADVVRLLLECPNVDKTIRDNDNLLAKDNATDDAVMTLFMT